MKKHKGRYYLSRVIKIGGLTQEKLISATLHAPVLRIGKYDWAITDAEDGLEKTPKYIFGKLSKFSSEGHVTVVDPNKRSQQEAPAPNLLVASSPFVYLPDYSGISFLHVWNGIQEDLFPKRFSSLVQAAYENFFVECSVEPVADYRAFIEKLDSLERISEMSAKVHPPNPLFGIRWEKLKNYIVSSNAEELSVKEKSSNDKGLKTDLLSLMRGLVEDDNSDNNSSQEVGVTEAAMLMAADGYGSGKIVGSQNGDEVVIRTADTHKSFLFAKEPEPSELARLSERFFKNITDERRMSH